MSLVQATTPPKGLMDLPNEILMEIANYLDPAAAFNKRGTNVFFCIIMTDSERLQLPLQACLSVLTELKIQRIADSQIRKSTWAVDLDRSRLPSLGIASIRNILRKECRERLQKVRLTTTRPHTMLSPCKCH